ncbi:DUF4267 domain-containing protein [Nocardia sp. NPDC050413]|uniref:DUF4267 domain-containing protein n=1 Tax=Nocardia sp. NPDC050413 TaxID=3155784 RepID=UPI0033C9DA9E
MPTAPTCGGGVVLRPAPETVAPGFGLPSWPVGDGGGLLNAKGVRDVAGGLILAALLLTGHRRALGVVLLAQALIPLGDMTNVMLHNGSAATAFGVHGLTAALILVIGASTPRETGEATAVPAGGALAAA